MNLRGPAQFCPLKISKRGLLLGACSWLSFWLLPLSLLLLLLLLHERLRREAQMVKLNVAYQAATGWTENRVGIVPVVQRFPVGVIFTGLSRSKYIPPLEPFYLRWTESPSEDKVSNLRLLNFSGRVPSIMVAYDRPRPRASTGNLISRETRCIIWTSTCNASVIRN